MPTPADWAIERALNLSLPNISVERIKGCPSGYPQVIAFARYIEQHEEPPVDPDLIQARELVSIYTNGGGEAEVDAVLAAIKWGRANP